MKHFGDVALQSGCAAILKSETAFPSSPTAGRIVFVDKRVWICAELSGGQPIWVPLTNQIDTYLHTQQTSSDTWTITHNLNTGTPLVQVYDTTNKLVIPGDVEVTDNNNVSVTFGTAVSGRAIVMYGSITGSEVPTYAFTYTQTTLATTWVIPHNLGYYPIVRVFVGGDEIQPQSIVHDSLFQTTITFSTSRTGIARLI